MNWDEKAEDYAGAHHTYEHRTPEDNRLIEKGIVNGARWQREQLRTDEAVERLALRLMNMMTPFDEWPTNKELGGRPTGDCDVEFKQAWMDETRAAITTLLGEDV